MQNIKLYIGAHKTATTHIQQLLNINRDILLKKDIGLSIPIDLRHDWIPLFFRLSENYSKDLSDEIIDLSSRNKTWIFSEENFSGNSFELSKKSGIYMDLKHRLDVFNELFKNCNIEVFFSIRSYETFYRSAYLEVIRNRGYMSFDDFYSYERFINNNWVDVISSIVSVIPETHITIWCYEDLNFIKPEIIQRMTNLKDITCILESYENKVTRPSISSRSFSIIKRLSKSQTYSELNKLTDKLNIKYPANKSNGYFMPFDNHQISSFKTSYSQDIKKIRYNYPNINYLGSLFNNK